MLMREDLLLEQHCPITFDGGEVGGCIEGSSNLRVDVDHAVLLDAHLGVPVLNALLHKESKVVATDGVENHHHPLLVQPELVL